MAGADDLQSSFRQAMAGVCTPVSVVTTLDGDRPHGTTVSAFASLSMNPPMVLVSLDRDSGLLRLLRPGGRFGLNILGSDQSELARAFARKGVGKFEGVTWQRDHGLPRLGGVCGWLACAVADLVEGGDHVIALGTVLVAESFPGAPLTYHARAFGTHQPLTFDEEAARPALVSDRAA
jgi:flavin reductase (DIM6/NTAB) family NADH-FMN oxidoreductase RutF